MRQAKLPNLNAGRHRRAVEEDVETGSAVDLFADKVNFTRFELRVTCHSSSLSC